MEHWYINLGEQAFLLINGPLIFLNLIANIFYAFCLMFPPCNRKRLTQPLMLLLGALVFCPCMYFVSLALFCWVLKAGIENRKIIILTLVALLFNLHNSLSTYVWLIFYYCIQIVPVQRALFIWVKNNIKVFIYITFFLEWTASLFIAIIHVVMTCPNEAYINGTCTDHADEQHTFSISFSSLLYMVLSLCLVIVCSVSTFLYLLRHMRSAAQGGSSFSTLQCQMKIAINGISHSVLFSLYIVYYLFSSFSLMHHADVQLGWRLDFTVTALYLTATTVSTGIGQAAFRERAAEVWKSLKACSGVGMVTNDVTLS